MNGHSKGIDQGYLAGGVKVCPVCSLNPISWVFVVLHKIF